MNYFWVWAFCRSHCCNHIACESAGMLDIISKEKGKKPKCRLILNGIEQWLPFVIFKLFCAVMQHDASLRFQCRSYLFCFLLHWKLTQRQLSASKPMLIKFIPQGEEKNKINLLHPLTLLSILINYNMEIGPLHSHNYFLAPKIKFCFYLFVPSQFPACNKYYLISFKEIILSFL